MHKRNLIVLLILAIGGIHIFAQAPLAGKGGEVMQFIFHPGNDTLYLQSNESEFKRLYSVVDQYMPDIASGKIPIQINGYCASAHSEEENSRLAFVRSNRVKSELITHKNLVEHNFITKNYTTAYEDHKDIVVVKLRIVEVTAFSELEIVEEPVVEVVKEDQVIQGLDSFVEEQSEPEPLTAEPGMSIKPWRRILSIRTNLLYDAFLTPTLGVEWYPNNNNTIGVKLDGSFAFWGNEHGRTHKLWIVSPEVRWYMGNARRFYLGAGGNIGEFNIYKGMVGNLVSGQTGYQGKLLSGGVTVGYLLKLNRTFSLDFNLGLGYTHLEYDTFGISNETRVYKGRDVTKDIWGPTQAGISLVWAIGR